MHRLKLIWLAISAAALAVAGLSYFLYGLPTTLRVAVAQGSIDLEIMNEAARILRRDRSSLQFKVIPVNDTAAVTRAMDSGNADLAIISSNQTLPAIGKTAVIMRRNAVLLLAPAGSKVSTVAELRGKSIGLIDDGTSDASRDRILDAILARSELPADSVTRSHNALAGLSAKLTSHSLDAVFVVGIPGDGLVSDVLRIVAEAGAGEPVFVPIGHINAFVQQSSAYESLTIPAGTFDGPTSRPAQDFETLAVSVRLFASTNLRDSVAGNLARTMFALKPKLAASFPVALRIQAPSTSKDANLPTHAGAAAYLDGEEENFFDRFSEFFYLGAMVLSIIGSAIAAIASRLSSGSKREYRAVVARLLEILRIARMAEDGATLRVLQMETDNIFAEFMAAAAMGRHEEPRISTLGLIVSQIHQALLDRGGKPGEAKPTEEMPQRPILRDAS